jgi:5-methylcytosine-specific restriction endonuclease McrA
MLKRKPINSRSVKRIEQDERRQQLRQKLLQNNPLCQRCRKQYATDLHEVLSRGRGGSPLDENNIVLLCRICHSFVTVNPKQAVEEGFLRSAYGQDSP